MYLFDGQFVLSEVPHERTECWFALRVERRCSGGSRVSDDTVFRGLIWYVASLRLGINIPHLSGFLDVAFRPSRGGAPRAQSGSLVLWFSFRVESRAANREEQG